MTMRFPDMVLPSKTQERLLRENLALVYSGHGAEYEAIAEAQHLADMAHEIACPLFGINQLHAAFWAEPAGMNERCQLCHGTGLVTLGALVAKDRARKGVPA